VLQDSCQKIVFSCSHLLPKQTLFAPPSALSLFSSMKTSVMPLQSLGAKDAVVKEIKAESCTL